MATKLAKKSVNNPAPSSPQLEKIKDLIALGITRYKSDDFEFEVHPGAVAKVISPVPTKDQSSTPEIDHDEAAFQTVFKGAQQ